MWLLQYTCLTLKKTLVIGNSLAPQEWMALLSWRRSQIENDLYIQMNLFSQILIVFLVLFHWHSPLCMTLLRISRHHSGEPKYQLKKGTEQLEIKDIWKKIFWMYFCVCPTDITVLKIFPLSFSFHCPFIRSSLTFFFFFSLCILKFQSTWAVLWCIPHYNILIFSSFVPL